MQLQFAYHATAVTLSKSIEIGFGHTSLSHYQAISETFFQLIKNTYSLICN